METPHDQSVPRPDAGSCRAIDILRIAYFPGRPHDRDGHPARHHANGRSHGAARPHADGCHPLACLAVARARALAVVASHAAGAVTAALILTAEPARKPNGAGRLVVCGPPCTE